MNKLLEQWEKDERARFKGWDFSYLNGRWKEEQPPWNYISTAKKLVRKSSFLLDMGTGGGEIFSKLAPLPKHAVATEGYKPNVRVARKRLGPLGVRVVDVGRRRKMPFSDGEFDLVLNRHDAFDAKEVFRILKPGGIFLTQQVGGGNLIGLIKEFGRKSGYKKWALKPAVKDLKRAGFDIKTAREWRGSVTFLDVGAVVYFLKAVPWCVPGFSVSKDMRHLERLQKKLNSGKRLKFAQVRYIVQAEKNIS